MTLANKIVTAPKIDRARKVFRSVRRARYSNLTQRIVTSPSGILGTYETRGSVYTITEINHSYATENMLCLIEGTVARAPVNFIGIVGFNEEGYVESFELIHARDLRSSRSTEFS
jgi:hypothetical protein